MIRYRIDPHLTKERFEELLPALRARDIPEPVA
jgi:hypothetical protein